MPRPAAPQPRRQLILGGQKSGKSRQAEARAAAWLAALPSHRAVFIATATAGDAEMRARIARHRADRAAALPRMATLEEPLALAEALTAHSRADTLLVVDCLTLWLANRLLPAHAAIGINDERNMPRALSQQAQAAMDNEATNGLVAALGSCPGPVVLVSNEIGLGVVPMGRETRAFVDALGLLNQRVAAACEHVSLMAAGLPLVLKEPACG